jgi:hypothetical protein
MGVLDDASWHKSSYSTNGGDCVEVAEGRNALIRDSRHRSLGHLAYPAAGWADLLAVLKDH